ncbi:serine/threonine-protein kinase [Aspergillus melleus]|uniref:serine/threonine-protein kinase n=1 Tax=Aspergillus melleus TaxID=138277 RepID=UPI001E8D68F8|nr:uncharacterized protein LDX57_012228 [Aspergillus melleus]KAH8434585.1 hypothetical protein LDX57_012228 [Aspergillus melleus]
MDEDPTHSQLDVTVLGDVSREVTYTSGSGNDNRKRNVTMWTKKRSLAVPVHVEETLTGLVRVIKKVKPHSPQVKDWRPEIQLMGRVSDETSLFIQLYGWFWSGDFVCIAMEYCPLGDLAACFSEPLSEVVTWGMCSQLLQGLARLHEMAITHRDIKPQNILVVTKDPLWVKIADFGISKQALDGETDLRTPRAGTEGFMAPEILGLTSNARKESKYTSAVDIWSLGCLLHYALTKESPFPKYQTLADHCRDLVPYPEAALTRRGISLSGRLFIKKLLVLEPTDRPAASVDLMSKWTVTETAHRLDLD